jgi:hypothetical protein
MVMVSGTRIHRAAPFVLTLGLASTVYAQIPSTTCGTAVSQLQSYVAQVNQFANAEYYRGIPLRCGGNPLCMQTWLGYLNQWYAQQSASVNGWYATLVRQCTAPTRAPRKKSVPLQRSSETQVGGLDEDAVEDLEVDDEDKTVRIRIPETPNGFRSR